MKVLLFTHKIDIDGMGSAILGKLAFSNFEYVLCETFDINNQVNKYYEDKSIYDYDYVFVADICIKEPLLTTLNNDKKLKGKIKIFDHHISEIREGNDKYKDWITIIVEDENGRCCGTSLFYKYLIDNKYLENKETYSELVELTRRYDTWEWQTIYNDEKSNDLNILFNVLGSEPYIKTMTDKLKNQDDFNFSDLEQGLIDCAKFKVATKVDAFIKNMAIQKIDKYKVGVTIIEDEYRNDVAMALRKRYMDIDLVMMIVPTRGTISYRSIKEDVDVGIFATKFGGNGHKEAASSPISSEKKEEIIDILLNKK